MGPRSLALPAHVQRDASVSLQGDAQHPHCTDGNAKAKAGVTV